ncbi:Protein CBG25501 [Caenorhabditis briggsae]|uniref:Protein CBG25501 n=2 Tax=Caenorhabditis briggsae TaxID=6238 RepID=B6IEP1_CAEBR|nr:Protein CBG25501 [Caenorhabditis briggsae]ULU04433.1 hypothetical protein L3Y34_017300 [Caenorhabditis briggsae]CAR98371.1 Protein CBG25501 [Caenorhabditis briggsae]
MSEIDLSKTSESSTENSKSKFNPACEDIEGKLRCLETLLEHPEATRPELAIPIRHLDLFLRACLHFYTIPKSKKIKERIELIKKACQFLEDVLIRVIVGGEQLGKAIKRIGPWSDPKFSFKVDCECNGFPSCCYIKNL